MLDLIIATLLVQTGDPCRAVPQGVTARGCPAWRAFERRQDGLESFVDPASVVRQRDSFEISVRLVYPTDRPNGMRSAVLRRRYDCTRRTHVMRRATTYNAAGAVLDDRDPRPHERAPQPSPEGSWNERFLVEFCPR